MFWSVGIVRDHLHRLFIELRFPPPVKRRKGFEPRDGHDPGGDLRTIFEGAGLAPHGEKDLSNNIFGAIGVTPDTNDEMVKANVMPRVQYTHRGVVSRHNRFDEVFVGSLVVRKH